MKRLPSLDGFRAISIILVVIAHSRYAMGFPPNLSTIASHGAIGVTFFFVISGFLITYLLLIEEAKTGKINITEFYIRRAFRILPVALLYILFISIWRNTQSTGLKNSDIIHALTFTVNFAASRGSWYVGHFWTLSVEEQFYLIWPAMLLLLRKHLKIILIIMILYSCLIRSVVHRYADYELISLSPFFSYSDSIFIGALGGIIYFENPGICNYKLFNNYFAQVGALFLIIVFECMQDYKRLWIISIPLSNLLISVSFIFLIFSNIKPSNKISFKILNNKILVHIGVLSYSIYIWQQLFFRGKQNMDWQLFLYSFALIYLVALTSYFIWERPFLKIKKIFLTGDLQPKIQTNHL